MDPSKRIVINTLAQHTRAIVNICLSLYSTRLVLQALGQSDYGIYALVAGVVTMLAFITNAMVVTTQRQLSFYFGKGNVAELKAMFSNSLLLHVVIGTLLAIILVALTPFIFDGLLEISPERIPTATKVYYTVILSLVITFLTAPYKALFVAHEEIVYISAVEIIDGVLKLAFALCLPFITYDKLMAYAIALACIMLFNYLALSLWSKRHFEESMLIPRLDLIGRKYIKELTGFATWTIYSMGCVIARSQGVAVIINRFFQSTIVNSAYGVAQQVYASVVFIATSVTNAMSPQIVKAESLNNRERMLYLSEMASKYAFLLLATVTIPLSFEMNEVLNVWLDEVPPHAAALCRFVLLTALVDQLTIGLGTANQAIGRIRNYSLVVNTIKVLTLPVFWLCLHLGYQLEDAMWVYIGFEFICAIIRLPFLKYTAGLSIRHFAKHVFARVAIPIISIVLVCYLVVSYVDMPFRFLLTGFVTVVISTFTVWQFALDKDERRAAVKMIKKKQTQTAHIDA